MDKIIFISILILFPFGQLFKVGFTNVFDLAVLLLAIITVLKKPKYPKWYKYFFNFLLFCVFGLALNYSLTTIHNTLYLVRLWSYSMIAVYILNYGLKPQLINYKSLITVAVVAAVFGFIQYLFYPDFRALAEFGWDDHYLRMVGTFFDPAFLGLIFVIALVLTINKKNNLITPFLSLALLFTYSRVSILLGLLVLLWNKKLFTILFLLFAFALIPKNIGEGTTITRTASATYKLQNYIESFEIIKFSPIYGVGFNNVCDSKAKILPTQTNSKSHSCPGLDASVLFLFATTGVIGLMLFVNFILQVRNSIFTGHSILNTTFTIILLHSLFSNSLFYPHIIFWMFVLVGLGSKIDKKAVL